MLCVGKKLKSHFGFAYEIRVVLQLYYFFAVKAGGMRITSKHHQSQHPVPTPEEKAEEEEFAEPKEK